MATDAYNLQFALGLGDRKLTSFTLRAAVNEFVTLDTTEIALKDSVQGLTREIVERQYRMVRWIPVNEALPPDNQSVFAWHGMTGAEMAYREDGAWRMSWTHYQVGPCEYTHWMPVPMEPQ